NKPAVTVPASTYASYGGGVNIITNGNVTTSDITTGNANSASPGTHFPTVGGDVMILAGGFGSAGTISSGAIETTGYGGGTVQLYTIGPSSSVTVSSIKTDTIVGTALTLNSGGIAISATGSISVTQGI